MIKRCHSDWFWTVGGEHVRTFPVTLPTGRIRPAYSASSPPRCHVDTV